MNILDDIYTNVTISLLPTEKVAAVRLTDEAISSVNVSPHPPPNFYEILVVPLLRQEKATVAYVSIVPIMFTCNQCYHKTRKEIASGAKGQ